MGRIPARGGSRCSKAAVRGGRAAQPAGPAAAPAYGCRMQHPARAQPSVRAAEGAERPRALRPPQRPLPTGRLTDGSVLLDLVHQDLHRVLRRHGRVLVPLGRRLCAEEGHDGCCTLTERAAAPALTRPLARRGSEGGGSRQVRAERRPPAGCPAGRGCTRAALGVPKDLAPPAADAAARRPPPAARPDPRTRCRRHGGGRRVLLRVDDGVGHAPYVLGLQPPQQREQGRGARVQSPCHGWARLAGAGCEGEGLGARAGGERGAREVCVRSGVCRGGGAGRAVCSKTNKGLLDRLVGRHALGWPPGRRQSFCQVDSSHARREGPPRRRPPAPASSWFGGGQPRQPGAPRAAQRGDAALLGRLAAPPPPCVRPIGSG